MDQTTRNPLLLFLLFGLFLLRAPQLTGPSMRPVRVQRSRSSPQALKPAQLWRGVAFAPPRAQQPSHMPDLFGDVGVLTGSDEFEVIPHA